MGVIFEGHPKGRPVSLSTYRNYACRCDGCRAESAAAMRDHRRKVKAEGQVPDHVFQRQLYQLCAAFVRNRYPETYESLKIQARRKVRARRNQ
jgi:hypothetical protein